MGHPLRVLLISGEYPPMEGGVGDYTRLLAEAMAAQGAEVHVLTSAHAAPQPGDSRISCYPVVRSWGWGAYRQLRRLIRDLAPDVLNIQYQAAAFGMHPAVNLLPLVIRGVPCITTFHDVLVPYLFPKAGPLRWRAVLTLARHSRAVIVTNREDQQKLQGDIGGNRLERIPIGSNVACLQPPEYDRHGWRQRLGVPQGALLLCYFGFLNVSKGAEELITAFDSVQSCDYNPHLLMIGGAVGASDPTNRTYYESVLKTIDDRGLGSRVIWTGFIPTREVSGGFLASDLCVLPYRDGVSLRRGSFMAALGHGLPIITTAPQVPLPELVHGRNIYLVPRQDARALGEAIDLLARDATLRELLGEGARELSSEFGWPRIAARTLEVYCAAAAS